MAYNKWVIIDWAGEDASKWEMGDERWSNFLLKTKHESNWFENATSLREVSAKEFILIILLDDDYKSEHLTELGHAIDSLFHTDKESAPIWCHYGGYFKRYELFRKWQQFPLLNKPLRDSLEKRLMSSIRYPIPFSWDAEMNLPWQQLWELFAKDFRSKRSWDILLSRINIAWEFAVEDLQKDAIRTKLESLLKLRIASDQVLKLIKHSSKNHEIGEIQKRVKILIEELPYESEKFELESMKDLYDLNQEYLNLSDDVKREECIAKVDEILSDFNKEYDSIVESYKNYKR